MDGSSFQWTSNLPMVTEGIDYAADAPAVFFGDRIDFLCARFDSPCEYGVRIVDRQNDANRDASERFGAEVVMLWRFIAEPKLGAIDRQPGDDTFVVSHAKYFQGAECSLVEIDGAGAAANAEPGSNRGGEGFFRFLCGSNSSDSTLPHGLGSFLTLPLFGHRLALDPFDIDLAHSRHNFHHWCIFF